VKVELAFSAVTGSAAWRRLFGAPDRTAISLRVHDDGRGFDSGVVASGHGMRGMRERSLRLGARLSVDSAPARGTVVHLEMRR
jgi:signal transduction histidine kinase